MTFAFDARGKLKGALAFVHHEAAGGLALMAAALAALIACNSPLAWLYDGFLHTPVGVRVGPLALDKPLLLVFARSAREGRLVTTRNVIEIGAGARRVAERDQGAGPVQIDLALKLRRGDTGDQGLVERLTRLGGIAGGEPGVAGLDPEIGLPSILGKLGVHRRLLEGGGGRRPAAELRIGLPEALARIEAAALDPPGIGEIHRLFGRRGDGGAAAFRRGRRRCGRLGRQCEDEKGHGVSSNPFTVAMRSEMSCGRDRR